MFKKICKRIKIIFLQVKLNECKDGLIDIVLDWNKCLQEENGKLKDQIEKMKCCGNCSHRHCWGNELGCNLDYDKEDECNHNNKKYWEFEKE